MEKIGLNFTDLLVRRMYGEAHDGLRAPELCKGLNIVYGPNAAGKTTLGRAVQSVLWPDRSDRGSTVEALFNLNGNTWRADLDAGHVRFEQDGRPADRPGLPLADHANRYHLYLHELLSASEEASKPFARAILQEAAGGIDIAEAQDTLGFREVRPARGKLTREADEAWEKVREVRTDQDALRSDQRRLQRLRIELEEARRARDRVEYLERVIAFVEARDAVRGKRTILKTFPDVLTKMTGEELDRLRTMRDNFAAAENDAEEATNRRTELRARIKRSIISEPGLDDGFISGLQKRVQQLGSCEQETQQIEKELAFARTEREEAWKRILGAVDAEKVLRIDVDAIGDLSAFVKQAEKVRAAESALLQQKAHYATGAERPSTDLEACREAARILSRWLQAGSSNARPSYVRALLLAAMVVMMISAVVLGATWLSLALLLSCVMVGWAAWRLTVSDAEGDERTRLREEFKKCAAPEPAKWDPEAVRGRLQDLHDELALHHELAFRLAKLTEVERNLDALEERKRIVDEERVRIVERLGLSADTEEEQLYYLVEGVRRWQELDRRVRGRESELEVQMTHTSDIRQKIDEDLEPYGFEAAEDAARAHEFVTTLAEAAAGFTSDTQALGQAERDLEKAKKAGERYADEIHELFERLELADDDEAGLHGLCARLDEFRCIQKAEIEAGGREMGAEERLKAHPLHDSDHIEESVESLKSKREAAQEIANRCDDLSDEIKNIEASVRKAECDHTLEEKRANHNRALEELRRKREEDFRSVTGFRLAEYIRKRTRDKQLPKVFHRARDLFGEITRQRYRLDFDDATEQFAAYDNVLQRGRSLDQLSSGTRVQLLLGVRLAFLEQQEQGVMVPLVLDETLANSDDGKAEEIISAVLSICRTGRQVFYFTAQEDEVRRWRAVLEKQNGVEHRFVSLGDAPVPGKIDLEALPVPVWHAELPDPSSYSHAEYGQLLKVPAWDFHAAVGSLHVWYLITDVKKLHRVLAAGFSRWGSLEKLNDSDGLDAVGLTQQEFRTLALCARALETWRTGWKIGRGIPVDRAVLLESGAVSDKFIDSVSELCDVLDGRGEPLLEALRTSEVSGFRSSKADDLEQYLLEHRYVDDVDPRSEDELWGSVVGEVAGPARELGVELSLVQEFLERVAALAA